MFCSTFSKVVGLEFGIELIGEKKVFTVSLYKVARLDFFGIVSITIKIEKRWCCIILKTTYFQSIHNSKNKKAF